MPVKIWELRNSSLTSAIAVRGSGKGSLEGESRREEAEALDAQVDAMLDRAVSLVGEATAVPEHLFLARRWAMGRATYESQLMDSPYLEPNEHNDLWLAIDRKCRHGIRADGSREDTWRVLVPTRTGDSKRPERDVIAVSLWLQEQDLKGTITAFGGKYGNAQRLFIRPALRSLNLREALAKWMRRQPARVRSRLVNNRMFLSVLKTLAKRFPSRGPGSAKRPVHYAPDDLYSEVCKVLDSIAEEVDQATSAQLTL